MTDYTITTNFGAKDSLPSGNASKVIKGSEFTTEFTNIATAVNSKADTAGDTFTGAVNFSAVTNFSADVAFDTDTLFVDASTDRVGIGTTSPDGNLDIEGDFETTKALVLTNTKGAGKVSYIRSHGEDGEALSLYHDGQRRQVWDSTGYISFEGTGGEERMRIDSDGDVLIGTTDNTLYNNNASGSNSTGTMITPSGEIQVARYQETPLLVNRMGNNGTCISIRNRGVGVGAISTTSTATTYITSSDERLKQNITDSADAGSKVDAIQIRQFDWKVDGSHQDYGVIAQELIEVAPEAVAEGDTDEDMMGVDYSKLVPMLVKEVQALRSRVAQLEESV